MSYQAIAGALALVDVSAGERLVALALASWANTEHRSYPGTRLATARAGMSKRQFEDARDTLARRGLIVVESKGGGRGHKAVVRLLFAETGPWCERELNAPLLEAVLSHSRLQGSARVLLAVLAACADADGVVDGLSTDELRAAAGMPDRTYRRARAALLASGEACVANAGGGRARLNEWLVDDPRASGSPPLRTAAERPTAPRGARPLMASARPLPDATTTAADVSEPSGETAVAGNGADLTGVSVVKGADLTGVSVAKGADLAGVSIAKGADLTGVSDVKGADLTGVSVAKGADLAGVSIAKGADLTGVSDVKGADLTGVSRKTPAQTPAETPAQTPAPNARTGRESLNLRNNPPSPPGGGSRQILLVEEFINDKGRRRQRTVTVDIDQVPVSLPFDEHDETWRRLRSEFERIAGSNTFEIWLAGLELTGVSDQGELLLAAPQPTAAWIHKRFGRLFHRAGGTVGCSVRLATTRELQMLHALTQTASPDVSLDHKEAV
jgi:hypothetical protein